MDCPRQYGTSQQPRWMKKEVFDMVNKSAFVLQMVTRKMLLIPFIRPHWYNLIMNPRPILSTTLLYQVLSANCGIVDEHVQSMLYTQFRDKNSFVLLMPYSRKCISSILIKSPQQGLLNRSIQLYLSYWPDTCHSPKKENSAYSDCSMAP